MIKLHQLRAGAPDKVGLWNDGSYQFIKHDNCNLVDWSLKELQECKERGEFILPADEGDIKFINRYCLKLPDQSFIMLPQEKDDNGNLVIIDYMKFIPKDCLVYKNVQAATGMKYAEFKSYTIEEFKNKDLYSDHRIAYKTTTGSGSRGVLLIDPNRVHLGWKYREFLTKRDLDEFISFAEKENCNIMMQELIPNDPKLTKVNCDFVLRDGKLLGYKWDKTDPEAVFTNWNFGWIVRTQYTDEMMNKIASYLTQQCGIVNAIMNFEAFSDFESETWLVEFNWRYSNSTFEGQAANIDLIGHYLRNEPFEFPEGFNKFSRYWRCEFYKDLGI